MLLIVVGCDVFLCLCVGCGVFFDVHVLFCGCSLYVLVVVCCVLDVVVSCDL